MKKDYEKMVGRTVMLVFDQTDSDHEQIKIVFTDGSSITIAGTASGSDVWYEGIRLRFDEPDPNQSLI